MTYIHETPIFLEDWVVVWHEVFSNSGMLLLSVANRAWKTWQTGDILIYSKLLNAA